MTPEIFRRLALSQPKAVEVYYRGHSEFRVFGRSFGSLGGPVDSVAMVQLTSEQQAMFMQAAPRTFAPVSEESARLKATSVMLVCADDAIVESALVVAWRNIVPISRLKSTDSLKIAGDIVDGDAGEQCIGRHGDVAVFIRRNRDPGKFWHVRLSTSAGDLVLPAPEMNRVISLLTTAYSMANQKRFHANGIYDIGSEHEIKKAANRKLRRSSQLEGTAKANANGVHRGRKPSIDPVKVRELKAKGMGGTEIAKQLMISRASVYRMLGGATSGGPPKGPGRSDHSDRTCLGQSNRRRDNS
jgi:hypothetical protein